MPRKPQEIYEKSEYGGEIEMKNQKAILLRYQMDVGEDKPYRGVAHFDNERDLNRFLENLGAYELKREYIDREDLTWYVRNWIKKNSN